MPMGVKAEEYTSVISALFRLTNIRGAMITMPHKVATVALMDELSISCEDCRSACNAILLPDGTLLGSVFDGEDLFAGWSARDERRKVRGLVVGSGGVGSAIAASLAGAGASEP